MLYFDLKCYRGRRVPASSIRIPSIKFSPLSKSDRPVLVFANEVPNQIKLNYLEKHHILIWDVQNLLWLFQEFEDIKSEFIALLDYSVSDIEPAPPNPNLFQEILNRNLNFSQEPSSETAPETGSEIPAETAAAVHFFCPGDSCGRGAVLSAETLSPTSITRWQAGGQGNYVPGLLEAVKWPGF